MVDPRASSDKDKDKEPILGPLSFPWFKSSSEKEPPKSQKPAAVTKPIPVLPPIDSADIQTYAVAQQQASMDAANRRTVMMNGNDGSGENRLVTGYVHCFLLAFWAVVL